MQQTDKYNLNIIETSDPFSPEALNENAQKLEDALVTHEAVVDSALKVQKLEWQAADAALDAALLRFKYGTYTGDGTFGKNVPTRLEFDFKPLLLIVTSSNSTVYGGRPWVRGITQGTTVQAETGTYHYVTLTWEDRAVEWAIYSSSDNAGHQLNVNGRTYYYLALGIAE